MEPKYREHHEQYNFVHYYIKGYLENIVGEVRGWSGMFQALGDIYSTKDVYLDSSEQRYVYQRLRLTSICCSD